jgi:hypothetical protein
MNYKPSKNANDMAKGAGWCEDYNMSVNAYNDVLSGFYTGETESDVIKLLEKKGITVTIPADQKAVIWHHTAGVGAGFADEIEIYEEEFYSVLDLISEEQYEELKEEIIDCVLFLYEGSESYKHLESEKEKADALRARYNNLAYLVDCGNADDEEFQEFRALQEILEN